MGIWDRLGSVLKSYINDSGKSDDKVFRRSASRGQGDPDLDAAYEELEDFLGEGGSPRPNKAETTQKEREAERKRPIPEEIRRDFKELGLEPEASWEECKEAYKKLLKIHHPDRHANHDGNMKKATDKTTRVNAAYERLAEWYKITGNK